MCRPRSDSGVLPGLRRDHLVWRVCARGTPAAVITKLNKTPQRRHGDEAVRSGLLPHACAEGLRAGLVRKFMAANQTLDAVRECGRLAHNIRLARLTRPGRLRTRAADRLERADHVEHVRGLPQQRRSCLYSFAKVSSSNRKRIDLRKTFVSGASPTRARNQVSSRAPPSLWCRTRGFAQYSARRTVA